MKSVLIVDDDPTVCLSLKRLLEKEGYKILTATSAREALYSDLNSLLNLAIVDFNLPDGDGVELIKSLKKNYPSIQTILVTGERSISVSAMENLKKDFFHFLRKPFEPSELLNLMDQALIKQELLETNQNLKANIKKHFDFNTIVGKSPEILKLTELLAKVSKSSCNLLITGESGTGKELVARAVHCAYNSETPFVSINCGAIPKDLLESEFFGHVRGAFTGAVNHRQGKFQIAKNGTLFLDEIGSMDLNLQVKLLRVLQERRFEPVGSNETLECNARIIAATNIDLEKAIKEGKFREDLYYRLNIITVPIVPLRERKMDIPLLIKHFIRFFNKNRSMAIEGISESALQSLCDYPWPGNVRELENLMERLSVLKEDGTITLQDLPKKYRNTKEDSNYLETVDIPDKGMDFNTAVDQYENSILLKALEKTNWNRRRAAFLLKMNRTTLVEKIKKKGLKPPAAV